MTNQSKKIAVLGAGPMGLAVAYQLARDGYQPVVFEADDRLGGMSASFDFSGVDIERYYHFHCTSDHAFLQLLDELNIADQMHWVETKMGYWYQDQIQAWGNPMALLRFKGLSLIAKIRYGLHAFLSTKRNKWQDLDRIEASAWIKRWVGQEAYDVLWRTLFEYKFYHYAGNLSAAWIWSRIRRIGRSRFDLFREKLGYLEGGSSTLLNAMAAFITQHGGEIRLSTPVKKVVIDSKKNPKKQTVLGLELAGVDQTFQAFDRVVSTVPLPYVSKLVPDLPDEQLDRYDSVNNIAVVCVIVKLKRAVSKNFWVNVNDVNMDIPGLVEYSNLRPMVQKDETISVVYVPFYMPFEHPKFAEPDENFIEKVKRYLCTINPQLQDSDFLDIRASRYRYAQPICEPGFKNKLPPIALPTKGLWVADTSYYYPEDRGISESVDLGRQIAQMVKQSFLSERS
jgi:protoporphyrinogen oxidase